MKALVIENEYEMPQEIAGFLKDNPTLFESVNLQIGCLHRPVADLARFIKDIDAVLVYSTWMYKDQLEQFVQSLASGLLGKKRYYIWRICDGMNKWNWKQEDGSYKEEFYFSQMEVFATNLKRLVTEQEVYSIENDDDVPYEQYTEPDFLLGDKYKRAPLIYKRVLFSADHDVFYLEGDDPKTTRDECAKWNDL